MNRLFLILALCAVTACKVSDVATPTEQQQLAALAQEEADALAAGDAAAAAAAAQKTKDLESEIGTGFMHGVLDWVDGFLPVPLEPFKSELAAGLALVAFRRPRKHLLTALGSVAEADPKAVMASTLKALGLKHSSDDPRAVIAAGIKLATKEGDTELVAALEAALAKLETAPAASA